MGKNKVRLTIGGLDYYITTDEEIAYMKNLGEDLDDEITGLIHDHPRLSQVQAAVLSALDYADRLKQAENQTNFLSLRFRCIWRMPQRQRRRLKWLAVKPSA